MAHEYPYQDETFNTKLAKCNILHKKEFTYRFKNHEISLDQFYQCLCVDGALCDNVSDLIELLRIFLRIFPKRFIRCESLQNLDPMIKTKRLKSSTYRGGTYILFIMPISAHKKRLQEIKKKIGNIESIMYMDFKAEIDADPQKQEYSGRASIIYGKEQYMIVFREPLVFWYERNQNDLSLNIEMLESKVQYRLYKRYCPIHITIDNYSFGEINLKIIWGVAHNRFGTSEMSIYDDIDLYMYDKLLWNHGVSKMTKIQEQWGNSISNPSYELCKKRLMSEFEEELT